MSLNTNPFVEGIDPTSTFGGYASVLLQLIRQAQPSSTYGMILFDTTAPDVTGANAWRKRCLWLSLLNPAQPALNVYRESAPGWVNVNDIISPDTITTAMIKDYNPATPGTGVTLAKLSVSGGTANQLIRVNASATAFEFVSLSSLVTAGSIPVSSLITTGIPAGQFRIAGTFGPGTASWYTSQNVIDGLTDGAISTDLIAPAAASGTRSKLLTTRVGDTFATWRYFDPNVDMLDNTMSGGKLQNGTVDVSKIVVPAGTPDGAYIGLVAGALDFIPFPTANTVLKYESTATALPAAGAAITPLTHGLGGQPINVYGVLVCVTAEHGYVAGDEIPLNQIYVTFSNNESPAFALHATTTQIHCVRNVDADLLTLNGSTGATAGVNLTAARWTIKFYALK